MTSACLMCAVLGIAASLLAQVADIGQPPGSLIDIGGRKLHLHCTGKGTPNVILEAGASAFAIDWALVQPEIARTNRVCSYDRAGSGWSDPAPGVRTPAAVVTDLHATLAATGLKPPYIMVGASMGGIYVRLYDLTYPGEVAGLVLVDPASEDRLFARFEGKGVTIASLTAEQLRSTIPPGPMTVPRRSPQTGTPFDLLPHNLYETRVVLETRLIASIPRSISRDIVVASAEGERDTLAKLLALRTSQLHPLGDRPVVVLTRGLDANQEVNDVHAALAHLSTNSRHTVVNGAGHEIHLFKPEIVIQAIRDVLISVATGNRLRER